MNYIKKNFFILFLLIYLVFGSITSLNIGISHDEYHEQKNWDYNVAIVENLFFNKEIDEKYQNYIDKYYGIGFQIISQPIQYFLKEIIIKFQNINEYGAKLLAKHFVIFLFFFVSGIFFYLILKKIINNKIFCKFSTILYLSYPYLLGHALFNPKDIPFLSAWLICTYISFNIFEKLSENKNINFSSVFFLGLTTAFLLSIRVTGILIFIQYIISFFIFFNISNINIFFLIKKIYLKIIFFLFFSILFTYIFYPIFWKNPLLIFTAIEYMGKYYHDVCTLTLGKCMNAKSLQPTYIPIWFGVKLPFLILLGIILIPFTEKKIFIDIKKNIFFGTVLSTSILIPLILIFKKVHLYDEIRHIMFLFPFIFILGLVSLYYFSNKIFYVLSFLTLSLFVFENFKIHPYQYVWFNMPSRVLDLTSKFELEYEGISGREMAKHLRTFENDNLCVLVSPVWSVRPFLNSKKFSCFGPWGAIDSDLKRPFLAVQHVRNLKKGDSYKCKSVFETNFKLLFYREKFITGKIIKCT